MSDTEHTGETIPLIVKKPVDKYETKLVYASNIY
jgi:hypothetical protein